jgi:hypothetical protein
MKACLTGLINCLLKGLTFIDMSEDIKKLYMKIKTNMKNPKRFYEMFWTALLRCLRKEDQEQAYLTLTEWSKRDKDDFHIPQLIAWNAIKSSLF